MKTILLLITATSALGCLTGCMNANKATTMNPEAVYRVPAAGMWTEDLIDDATGKKQGRMYVLPGTFMVYDGTEVR